MRKIKSFLVHIVALEYANNGKIGSGNGGGNFEWRFNKKDADHVHIEMQSEKKRLLQNDSKCAVQVYRTTCKIEGVAKNKIEVITEMVDLYLSENGWEKTEGKLGKIVR